MERYSSQSARGIAHVSVGRKICGFRPRVHAWADRASLAVRRTLGRAASDPLRGRVACCLVYVRNVGRGDGRVSAKARRRVRIVRGGCVSFLAYHAQRQQDAAPRHELELRTLSNQTSAEQAPPPVGPSARTDHYSTPSTISAGHRMSAERSQPLSALAVAGVAQPHLPIRERAEAQRFKCRERRGRPRRRLPQWDEAVRAEQRPALHRRRGEGCEVHETHAPQEHDTRQPAHAGKPLFQTASSDCPAH
jgi:hypothetical protein